MTFWYVVLIGVSCFWIYKACHLFEKGADILSVNMKKGLKGATVTAIGSSLPELVISILFLFFFRDEIGFASGFGTVLGSAMFNLLVIPGVSLLVFFRFMRIKKVKLNKDIILRDGIFFVFALGVCLFFLKFPVLNWIAGLSLMFVYVGYFLVLMIQQKKFSEQQEKKVIPLKLFWKSILKITVALLQVTIACFMLAEAVIKISEILKINPYFVALILSAMATSIPDFILSVKDARKGEIEESLSNAIGSNIFDLCIAIGLPVFIYTLIFSPISLQGVIRFSEVFQIILGLILFTVLGFMLPKFFKPITAILYLLVYFIFITYCAWVYLF